MIPFTQPSTAPDGTARRPLAERVPECVPKHECLSMMLDGRSAWSPDGHLLINQRVSGEHEVASLPESVSSALWRVAVEDWIYRQCDFDLCGGTLTFVLEDRAVCSLNTWVTLGDPLPVVDLLNAAAHAVADAMGIAP